MHHLQGRPLAEIARELDTTKAAVAGLLHRGLKSLRGGSGNPSHPLSFERFALRGEMMASLPIPSAGDDPAT